MIKRIFFAILAILGFNGISQTTPTLQQVTTSGNTTSKNIFFHGATGIFGTDDAHSLDFYSNNLFRGRLTSGGQWFLGSAGVPSLALAASLTAVGSGTTSASFAFAAVDGSLSNYYFYLRNDSKMFYRDGNQAANFLLQSDANGMATWVNPSSFLGNYIPLAGATNSAPVTGNIYNNGKKIIYRHSSSDSVMLNFASAVGGSTTSLISTKSGKNSSFSLTNGHAASIQSGDISLFTIFGLDSNSITTTSTYTAFAGEQYAVSTSGYMHSNYTNYTKPDIGLTNLLYAPISYSTSVTNASLPLSITTNTISLNYATGLAISSGSLITSAIPNSAITNSLVTINSSTVALGGSVTVTANTTNALTVDNSSLQLNSGTTFNGSSTVTISAKQIPITSGGTNNTSTLTTNGVNYFDGIKITNKNTFFFDGTNLKIGNSTAATQVLDVQGNIGITTSGVSKLRLFPSVPAGAIGGAGLYSNNLALTLGAGNGLPIDFVGVDGNTSMAQFTSRGAFWLGGLSQWTGTPGLNPFVTFRKDTAGGAYAVIENQNSYGRAGLHILGEKDNFPATNARRLTFYVINRVDTGFDSHYRSSAFIASGGDLFNGLRMYADNGPIDLGTRSFVTAGVEFYRNDLHINKYSDTSGVVVSKAGYVGVNVPMDSSANYRFHVRGTSQLGQATDSIGFLGNKPVPKQTVTTYQGVANALVSLGLLNTSSVDPAWVDYTSSATIVGFSSYFSKYVLYMVVGKMLYMQINIDGVSNATNCTISIPSPYTSLTGSYVLRGAIWASDGAGPSYSIGSYSSVGNTSTITFYKDAALSNWTASGEKAVVVTLSIPIN